MTRVSKKELSKEKIIDSLTANIGLVIFILGMLCAWHPSLANIPIILFTAGFYGVIFMILGLAIVIVTVVFGREIRRIRKEINEEDEEEWRRKHEFHYAG